MQRNRRLAYSGKKKVAINTVSVPGLHPLDGSITIPPPTLSPRPDNQKTPSDVAKCLLGEAEQNYLLEVPAVAQW